MRKKAKSYNHTRRGQPLKRRDVFDMGREKGLPHRRAFETPNRDFQKSSQWMQHEGDITDSARWQEAYTLVDSLVGAELAGNEGARVKLAELYKKAVQVNEYAARSLDTILRSLQVAEKVVVEEKFPSTLIRLMTEEERADREKRRNWAMEDSKTFSLAA